MLRRLSLVPLLLLIACAAPAPESSTPAPEATATASPEAEPVEWAIAIHGGAGVIEKDKPPEEIQAYRAALESALRLGVSKLEAGESALDVVEAVVRQLEDAPEFNAGKGSVFTNDGRNELDAAIMDGRDLSAGAVARVTTVKNPITLARGVMEQSKHVFMTGDGAEAFGAELGVETVDSDYFFTQRRYDQLEKARAKEKEAEKHGTVGAVVRDKAGNLAAATSTGGMTNKRFGRIGDVPVIGAGTYADNRGAAVSCTGWGEKFIRNTVAYSVTARMRFGGASLEEAARGAIHDTLDPQDGGLIAVDQDGRLALVFNSLGMFRGAADASGRFEVAIWQD